MHGPTTNRMITPGSLRHREDDQGAVSPSELAREWGVSLNTVYRDLRKGALPGFRMPGGRIRIRRDDARRYGRPIE